MIAAAAGEGDRAAPPRASESPGSSLLHPVLTGEATQQLAELQRPPERVRDHLPGVERDRCVDSTLPDRNEERPRRQPSGLEARERIERGSVGRVRRPEGDSGAPEGRPRATGARRTARENGHDTIVGLGGDRGKM